MQCPQCKQPLVIVECDHVELDVCFDGHGIWFDADELRQLFELAGARERDSGMEARFDHLSAHSGPKRRCPRCRGRMRHVEAPGASEGVILDECPKGQGLWFDDGELHEVDWNTALDRAAEGFRKVLEEHGRHAVYGVASGRAPNEAAYTMQKFIRAGFGTNQIDNCSRA